MRGAPGRPPQHRALLGRRNLGPSVAEAGEGDVEVAVLLLDLRAFNK